MSTLSDSRKKLTTQSTSVKPVEETKIPKIVPEGEISYYLKGTREAELELIRYFEVALQSKFFQVASKFVRNAKCKCKPDPTMRVTRRFRNGEIYTPKKRAVKPGAKASSLYTKPMCERLNHNQIDVLLKRNPDRKRWGFCESCNCGLTFPDPASSSHLPRNIAFLCTTAPYVCKNSSTIDAVVCHACSELFTLCYSNKEIWNYYQNILLKFRPGPVETDYHRTILDKTAVKSFPGYKKPVIMEVWGRQKGFVRYPIPGELKPFATSRKLKAINTSEEEQSEGRVDDSTKQENKKVGKLNENLDFVTFFIPLEYRKTMEASNLSYMVPTAEDLSKPIGPDNFLLTTRLLSSLSKLYTYNDFLIWAVCSLRLSKPSIVRPKSQSVLTSEKERKEWEEYSQIFKGIEEKKAEQSAIAASIKQDKILTNKWSETLKSKIIKSVISHGKFPLCEEYNLKPSFCKTDKTTLVQRLTNEYIAHALPLLLMKQMKQQGLIEQYKLPEDVFNSVCATVVTQLASKEVRGVKPKSSTFELVFDNKLLSKEFKNKSMKRRKLNDGKSLSTNEDDSEDEEEDKEEDD
jgi:hypothetical protein